MRRTPPSRGWRLEAADSLPEAFEDWVEPVEKDVEALGGQQRFVPSRPGTISGRRVLAWDPQLMPEGTPSTIATGSRLCAFGPTLPGRTARQRHASRGNVVG
jgi:hypothetical protein